MRTLSEALLGGKKLRHSPNANRFNINGKRFIDLVKDDLFYTYNMDLDILYVKRFIKWEFQDHSRLRSETIKQYQNFSKVGLKDEKPFDSDGVSQCSFPENSIYAKKNREGSIRFIIATDISMITYVIGNENEIKKLPVEGC